MDIVLLVANCRTFSRSTNIITWLDRGIEKLVNNLPSKNITIVIGKDIGVDLSIKTWAFERNITIKNLDVYTDDVSNIDIMLEGVSHIMTLWDGEHRGMLNVILSLRDRDIPIVYSATYNINPRYSNYKQMRIKSKK